MTVSMNRAQSLPSPNATGAPTMHAAASANVPSVAAANAAPPGEFLLAVQHLRTHFPVKGGLFSPHGTVKAVDEVSFGIRPGEVMGLVGESGSGKTTLGRSILRLVEPTSGSVRFEGVEVTQLPAGDLRRLRKDMQIIFQDPYASLNPRMTVAAIIGQALDIHHLALGAQREARMVELLRRVGLSADTCAAIRTNSPAASASGSASLARSASCRGSSSRTSRCRHWTCRSRPKCSICSRT